MTDNDRRLITIETKLDTLIKGVDNHLNHHFRYSLMAWTVAIGLVITLIIKYLH